MYDLGRTERVHRAIQADNRAVFSFSMRKCAGACKLRRSTGQFKGESTVCIRCAARGK